MRAERSPEMDLVEIIACAPRGPGGWHHFSAMLAFVFLAWAYRGAAIPGRSSG